MYGPVTMESTGRAAAGAEELAQVEGVGPIADGQAVTGAAVGRKLHLEGAQVRPVEQVHAVEAVRDGAHDAPLVAAKMRGVIPNIGAAMPTEDVGEFERLVARIPLHEQREKWRTARSGFSAADLADATRKVQVAVDKVEAQLARTPWLAGEMYTLADINFFSHCGMYVARMFPELSDGQKHPRLTAWRERMLARPGVQAALAMPDHTNPALRTFTGEAR